MRTKNQEFRLFFLAGICAAVASCSVVKNDVALADLGERTKPAVKTTVSTSSRTKTYAFSSRKPIAAAIQEEKAVALISESRPSYLGNAPYICTPSGFGRKAQCFLR